jgi:bifunctional DNA-binding transcriptional regulator/antitoxin component of YhaV-PrlF toxin-antitoxin module
MSTMQSKVTAQGQTSVPAEVRRQLGVGPGRTKPTDVEAGVRDYIRRKHARG